MTAINSHAILVFGQDFRGCFVIGKAFRDAAKAKAYADELSAAIWTKRVGPENRYIECIEVQEIEIVESDEDETPPDLQERNIKDLFGHHAAKVSPRLKLKPEQREAKQMKLRIFRVPGNLRMKIPTPYYLFPEGNSLRLNGVYRKVYSGKMPKRRPSFIQEE